MFLYMDPQLSAAQFANIVAHELHHVGYASVAERFSAAIADLPPGPHTAAAWMGAFGEGFAMLAAAGGPDVHPHAVSPPEDRARWDRDVANFAQDLVGLDNLFLDIVDGSLAAPDTIRQSNAPVYSRAALREVFSVGAAAGPDEYVFTEMVMFVVGPSGELYIADINGEVRMFDATGRFVRAVGRIGKGPGETQFVVGMAVSNDG